jgi:hypothetical protein
MASAGREQSASMSAPLVRQAPLSLLLAGQRPNKSIERTASGTLRVPPPSAHLQRYGAPQASRTRFERGSLHA